MNTRYLEKSLVRTMEDCECMLVDLIRKSHGTKEELLKDAHIELLSAMLNVVNASDRRDDNI